MRKLLTANEWGLTRPVIKETLRPNSLAAADPVALWFVQLVIDTLLERNLPNGHLYAYLAVRFRTHRFRINWTTRSFGKAGHQSRMLMLDLDRLSKDEEWIETVDVLLPGDIPHRERVFLAWLQGADVSSLSEKAALQPIAERLISSRKHKKP